MFNREPPGCVQGHQNPNDKLETRAQTARRYALATEAILKQATDAVLLQELSVEFFDEKVNPAAPALLASYDIALQTNAAGPGTGVLLRKGGSLVPTGKVFRAGASEATGGTSKSASGVLVRVGERGELCWLVSVHLTPVKFNAPAVRTHLELLGAELREDVAGGAAAPRVVIGGDLNAELHEVATLQREYATLGGYAHVAAPGDTGLSADFSQPVCIDHLFVSAGLALVGDMQRERPPASPFAVVDTDRGCMRAQGPSAVIAASDHVWLRARLAVQ